MRREFLQFDKDIEIKRNFDANQCYNILGYYGILGASTPLTHYSLGMIITELSSFTVMFISSNITGANNNTAAIVVGEEH